MSEHLVSDASALSSEQFMRVLLKMCTSIFLVLQQYRQFSSALVREAERISFELIHEQLPLPVPCYDLLPVTELTVNRLATSFGYSRLP